MVFVAENLRYLKERLKSIALPRFARAAREDAGAPVAPSGRIARFSAARPRLAKAGRIAAVALLVFLALPYIFTVFYRFIDPPFSALMLRHALSGSPVNQQWVSLDAIADALPRAVVTSEDSAFCQHWGVDWQAVGEAIEDAEEGEIPRGASTIPMQLAKNLYLWPEQTYIRKAFELPLAYWITLVWPKRRVLEVYLNIAEWGPGIFGAEAAARRHFGKSAADLTAGEAALLAGALPNPIIRRAGNPGPRLRNKAARLQARVAREGGSAECVFN